MVKKSKMAHNARKAALFFADILGFSKLSSRDPLSAGLALESVGTMMSEKDAISRHLNKDRWDERYALSDSILLLKKDLVSAVISASEFFFNCHFVNFQNPVQRVLMRGPSVTISLNASLVYSQKHAAGTLLGPV